MILLYIYFAPSVYFYTLPRCQVFVLHRHSIVVLSIVHYSTIHPRTYLRHLTYLHNCQNTSVNLSHLQTSGVFHTSLSASAKLQVRVADEKWFVIEKHQGSPVLRRDRKCFSSTFITTLTGSGRLVAARGTVGNGSCHGLPSEDRLLCSTSRHSRPQVGPLAVFRCFAF